jgi:short-subunit dehydrogenase involved in D-alanine esterification of teichoic acids
MSASLGWETWANTVALFRADWSPDRDDDIELHEDEAKATAVATVGLTKALLPSLRKSDGARLIAFVSRGLLMTMWAGHIILKGGY